MKYLAITREIDGRPINITLTGEEMRKASDLLEHYYDEEDVRCVYESEFDGCGVPLEELNVSDIAYDKHDILDSYEDDAWREATIQAIQNALDAYREEME